MPVDMLIWLELAPQHKEFTHALCQANELFSESARELSVGHI